MTSKEIIKHLNKIVAVVIRRKMDVNGVNFFTNAKDPLQVALHNYSSERETNIHKNNVRKPVIVTEFHKFLFMTDGMATVCLMSSNLETYRKIRLSTGDGIIIMNTFHKVVFTKRSNAIEIKQGPYAPDT
jgi:rRNA maturation protein Rpf1